MPSGSFIKMKSPSYPLYEPGMCNSILTIPSPPVISIVYHLGKHIHFQGIHGNHLYTFDFELYLNI